MAQEGGFHILRSDAAAVVGNADERHAAVLQLHRHSGGAGVGGVFKQLLNHRGRALYHLAGGDEVGHMGVQGKNFWHGVPPFNQRSLRS
ncbi:hypothetical protein SDC9_136886 [bioreactor metagenome]|uniref:Uncharacterized protein n=1 Tax=bioreactor metagenome TaxID=1076179 RepID=A0A645DK03_9ZZZZ